MKLVVGLGNPGKKYENTRHNIGFYIVDNYLAKNNIKINQLKPKYHFVKDGSIIYIKPQTFMNLSGDAVVEMVNYYNIKKDDILVIYDDVSFEVGSIKYKSKGSHGGQNGIKDIINKLGTDEIKRIRVGIGSNGIIPIDKYVLGKFTKEQSESFSQLLRKSHKAIDMFIANCDTNEIQALVN